ncbi:carbonic anhydrase [Desertibaculum subflavum]|uniref:carbonic anhydrase n=1 Tax=Desertibaculum subflavum TaxID=2268458 RepID=UPI000E660E0E
MRHSRIHAASCTCHLTDRRQLLRMTGLAAAGAAAVAAFGLPRLARAAGATEALLLSCMDYRLMDDVARYMDGRKLTEKYDHVILAGASIGVTNEKYPAWGQTFWDHVGVAAQLHHIKKVIVMDHRDCGAYKLFLGPEHAKDRAVETAAHGREAAKLKTAIKAKHPDLEVELLLMALDGSVESLAGV